MEGTGRARSRLRVLAWLLLWATLVAAGLYFGYVRPELTATVILLVLVGVWIAGERLTGKWWY